ncbi:hypothetical protein DFP72DRAFT_1076447 [Ephemerocybe angulata]|uniref:Uncharacterized protein n=1 Tax=Ephemerocybe angulata TaxID=980116 RepID=A0A8H6LW97_9AGAR|nr:hypothetical protein DFP72DRAFT_1076447 [Tulosesus angulatus]
MHQTFWEYSRRRGRGFLEITRAIYFPKRNGTETIRLMWFAPLSIPKVLFFVVKYYLLVNNVFAALWTMPTGRSPNECKSAFVTSAVSSSMLVVASEAILYYRVYGFSGRSVWMLLYLLFQYVVVHTAKLVLLFKYIGTLIFKEWPYPNMTCMPFDSKAPLFGAVFAVLLGGVTGVMLIMVFVAYKKHRSFNSALLKVFYQDGVFYFICLAALASANMGVSFGASSGYRYLFTQLEIDVHALLSTRMLLHLREIGNREASVTGSGIFSSDRLPTSPMRFEKPGAHLGSGDDFDTIVITTTRQYEH